MGFARYSVRYSTGRGPLVARSLSLAKILSEPQAGAIWCFLRRRTGPECLIVHLLPRLCLETDTDKDEETPVPPTGPSSPTDRVLS